MDNNQSWNNPSSNMGNQTVVNDSKVLEKLDRLIEIGNSQEATLEKLYQMFVVEKNVLNDKKEELIDNNDVVEPIVEEASLQEVPETIEQTENINNPIVEEQPNIEVPEVETVSVDNNTNSDSLLGIDAILNSVPAEQTSEQKVEEVPSIDLSVPTEVPEVAPAMDSPVSVAAPQVEMPSEPVINEQPVVAPVAPVEQAPITPAEPVPSVEQNIVEEVPSIDLSVPTEVPEVAPVMDSPVSVAAPQVEMPSEPVINEQPVVAPVAPVTAAPEMAEQVQIQPEVVSQPEINNAPVQAEPEYTIENIIVSNATATASSQRNTIVSGEEQQRLLNTTQEMNNVSNGPTLTNTLNLAA